MVERTALVLRENSDALYICHRLVDFLATSDSIVILESGSTARRNKLRRMWKKRGVLLLLDLAALWFFDLFQRLKMSRKVALSKLNPREVASLVVDDVNDATFLSFIQRMGVTKILTYGTAIYSESTLSLLKVPILNFHSGILPKYRNVHTDFWAYMKRDFDGLGVSVFVVGTGIDNGLIIETKRPELLHSCRLWGYKVQNLKLVGELLSKFLTFPGEIPEYVTDESPNCETYLCPTPVVGDIFKYFLLEASLVLRDQWRLRS
jgi:hypothetical protein